MKTVTIHRWRWGSDRPLKPLGDETLERAYTRSQQQELWRQTMWVVFQARMMGKDSCAT